MLGDTPKAGGSWGCGGAEGKEDMLSHKKGGTPPGSVDRQQNPGPVVAVEILTDLFLRRLEIHGKRHQTSVGMKQ